MTSRHSSVTRRSAAILLLAAGLAACQAAPVPTQSPGAASATPGATAAVQPGALPAIADVPIFKVDARRSGIHPGPGPVAQPVQAWSTSIECLAGGRTVGLADGLVLAVCDVPTLIALDARTGATRWRTELAGPATDGTTPTVADGVVFVGTSGGTFEAMDLETGKPVWTADLPDTFRFPALDGDRIFVGAGDGRYVGLDRADGSIQWSWQSPLGADHLLGTIVDGIAYICGDDNWLYAVDIATKAILWQQQGPANRFSSPTISDDLIVVGAQPEGPLTAFDRATGAERWRVTSPTGGQIVPPVLADGVVYAPSSVDGLFAVELTTGKQLWTGDTGPVGGQAPAIVGDIVYVTADRELQAFDRVSGAKLWAVDDGADLDNSSVVSGGMVFTSDNSGNVRAWADPALVAMLPTGSAVPSDRPSAAPTASTAADLELVATFDASTVTGLDQPSGIDVGPDGMLYVVNALTDEILVVDPGDGHVLRRWGASGSQPGQFNFLRAPDDPGSALGGVAVADDGKVYVADTVNRRVQVFSPDGTYIDGWGRFGEEDGQFMEPVDIAIGPAGDVYVVDDQRDDIQRFTPDGTHKATIGKHGTAPGELNFSASIDVGPTGAIVQADFDNSRIQAWDDQGASAWTFGPTSSGPSHFTYPYDVSLDDRNRVYVSDLGRVQALDAAQQLIGEAKLPGVDASYLANDGTFLYVTKPFTDEILKLRLLP